MRAGRGVRLLVGALIAVVLLGFFFRGVDARELGMALSSAHPGWLSGIVVSAGLTYVVRAWRWGAFLQPLAPVPLGRLVRVTVVGFMSGLFIPRASEFVRPYLVTRSHGVATAAGFATVVLERVVDLITVLGFFFLYLYVLPYPSLQRPEPLPVLRATGIGAAAVAFTALVVLAAFHFRAEQAMTLVDRALRWLPARAASPLARIARSFSDGLAVLKAPLSHLAWILAQSVLLWLSIALGIWSAGLAFGLDLPFHSTFLILGFLTVGVSIPTPGMVGGFHEAYLLALTQGFGADRHAAAAAGLALHALTNLPVLLVGLLWLSGEGLTLGRVQELADDTGEDRR
ncbi:MAG TPA: lysylphosphatidylglycerol synthase transmembrane domain-containing protein [Vicinamibacteria bacterium]|nr:lysylphosphatidylglycerol synthase transmembrane domain-containing protein [Vicinamibacteria bacterium]